MTAAAAVVVVVIHCVAEACRFFFSFLFYSLFRYACSSLFLLLYNDVVAVVDVGCSFVRSLVCFCFAFNALNVFFSLFFGFISLSSLCVCLYSSELSALIMCRSFVSSVFNADEYRRYSHFKSNQMCVSYFRI